jgi:hypothetical protein
LYDLRTEAEIEEKKINTNENQLPPHEISTENEAKIFQLLSVRRS